MLEKNVVLDYISLYKMSEEQLKVVKKYLEHNWKKEFIAANCLSFASSVMFMKKTNESLKFCVDYRKLNQLTKKNKYSLSFIDEILTHLRKIKYFIELDIRKTFHRIRIANANSKNLITFRIRFEVYKYCVLLFELCNKLVTYQYYMNDVFFDYFDDFVFAYINDIFIYNNFKKKYIKHVKKILQCLRDTSLQANIDKCEFFVYEIKYLNLIVRQDEIKMNSKKIETILQWSISENLRKVQELLKFCNFYEKFIKNFVKIVKSLIKVTRKNVIFNWNEACKVAFNLFKKTIIEHLDINTLWFKKTNIHKKWFLRFRFRRSFFADEKEWWIALDDVFFKKSCFCQM